MSRLERYPLEERLKVPFAGSLRPIELGTQDGIGEYLYIDIDEEPEREICPLNTGQPMPEQRGNIDLSLWREK